MMFEIESVTQLLALGFVLGIISVALVVLGTMLINWQFPESEKLEKDNYKPKAIKK